MDKTDVAGTESATELRFVVSADASPVKTLFRFVRWATAHGIVWDDREVMREFIFPDGTPRFVTDDVWEQMEADAPSWWLDHFDAQRCRAGEDDDGQTSTTLSDGRTVVVVVIKDDRFATRDSVTDPDWSIVALRTDRRVHHTLRGPTRAPRRAPSARRAKTGARGDPDPPGPRSRRALVGGPA